MFEFDFSKMFGNSAAKAEEEHNKEFIDSQVKITRTEKYITQLENHFSKLKECTASQAEVFARDGDSELYRALLKESELRRELIGMYAMMLGIEHGTW